MTVSLWRIIQKDNFTLLNPLISFLELEEKKAVHLINRPAFPLNLPRRLAEKIAKNSLDDPILKQFVPLAEETQKREEFSLDPVHDQEFRKEKKLLKKYEGRALLISTSACAMHCRYCFRQHFDYETEAGFEKELEYLRQDPTINEVILSGGDPLSLGNDRLKQLIDTLETIPHLKILRFHSRFPIGIPERIDEGFLKILASTRLQVIFVVHCNHAQELDEEILSSLKKIRYLGIPILNQSVLLKGINDSFDVLKALCTLLIENGMIPYYLHQLDQVAGAGHFEVSPATGIALIEQLRASLPGFAVPRYVKEIANEKNKTLFL